MRDTYSFDVPIQYYRNTDEKLSVPIRSVCGNREEHFESENDS